LLARGFGEGVDGASAERDGCLIEGIVAHELAHEALHHITKKKIARAPSDLLTLGLATPAVKAFDRAQEEAADSEAQERSSSAPAARAGR
jgi:predicted SprT family Zn-dependent metalloprotease